MLPTLLIIIYSSIFCFILLKVPTISVKELSSTLLILAFVAKIITGMLYGFIHNYYFQGGDTFNYFESTGQIANTIFSHPNYYISVLLGKSPEVPLNSGVFEYPDWNYLRKDFGTYLLVHLHTLPQILSFGFYNVHIVFIAFLSMLASMNFYRALSDTLHVNKKLLVFISFFMPSVLFWTSGLHKDVWVYFGMSLILLGLRELYKQQKVIVTKLFIGLIIVGLFRYYLIPLLIPGIFAYTWAVLSPSKIILPKFITLYLGFAILLFLSDLTGFYPFLEMLSERQQEFLRETGDSAISGIEPLKPTLLGLLSKIPSSVINVSFRPFLWDCKDILQLIAAIEILAFWILALLIFPLKKPGNNSAPMGYFLLFYGIANMLLIGILVSNVGTIVRYRTIALAMLSLVILQTIDVLKNSKKGEKGKLKSMGRTINKKVNPVKTRV